MDEEPEEYVKMKYSRDDEIPRPWAVKDLAHPLVSSLGFYPASEFGVLTKLIQQVGHSCAVPASFWRAALKHLRYLFDCWTLRGIYTFFLCSQRPIIALP